MSLFDEVKSVVDSMRLPPNVKMRVQEGWYGSDVQVVWDAEWTPIPGTPYWRPGDTFRVIGEFNITEKMLNNDRKRGRREDIKTLIYVFGRASWVHEYNEWLQFDGVHYNDPHPNGTQVPVPLEEPSLPA